MLECSPLCLVVCCVSCLTTSQVPHLTTKVSNLKLYDSAGRVVLDTPVPEEQQTRYVLDGDRLVNRLRIPMSQTSAPEGDITDVAAVSIERMGRGDLANIDPKDRHIVFWVMSSLRFRFGCKGARTTVLLEPRSVRACKAPWSYDCRASCCWRVLQNAAWSPTTSSDRTPSSRCPPEGTR